MIGRESAQKIISAPNTSIPSPAHRLMLMPAALCLIAVDPTIPITVRMTP